MFAISMLIGNLLERNHNRIFHDTMVKKKRDIYKTGTIIRYHNKVEEEGRFFFFQIKSQGSKR
jgi:hypothetical protein